MTVKELIAQLQEKFDGSEEVEVVVYQSKEKVCQWFLNQVDAYSYRRDDGSMELRSALIADAITSLGRRR